MVLIITPKKQKEKNSDHKGKGIEYEMDAESWRDERIFSLLQKIYVDNPLEKQVTATPPPKKYRYSFKEFDFFGEKVEFGAKEAKLIALLNYGFIKNRYISHNFLPS